MSNKKQNCATEESQPLNMGGVSNRYSVSDIRLSDWECVAIGDTKTNHILCHFITENCFDEAVEMANKICDFLNGCNTHKR